MLTPKQCRYAKNEPVYLPTMAYCREIVSVWSREKLTEQAAFYADRLGRDLRDPRFPERGRLISYYQDMARAIDDELLGRDLDEADNPFFEEAVADYDPGDMIDLTI